MTQLRHFIPGTTNDKHYFWLSFIFASIFYFTVSALRHYYLQSGVYDLGLFTQWSYLVSQGHLWEPSSLTGYIKPALGDHFSLLLIPIGLLFHLWPSAYFLLLVQSLGLGILSATVFSAIAHPSQSKPIKVALFFSTVLNPYVINSALNDFHPEVAFAFFGLLALIDLRNSHFLRGCAFLILYLFSKEAMAIFGFSVGLYILFGKRRFLGFAILVVSLSYFFYASSIVESYQSYAQGRFGQLGSTYPEIIWNTLTNPLLLLQPVLRIEGIIYLASLFLPFFLLFSWPRSLPAVAASIPLLAVNLLSSADVMRSPIYQYQLPICILLFIACLDSVNSSGGILSRRDATRSAFVCLLLVWSLSFGLLVQHRSFLTRYLSTSSLAPTVNVLEHKFSSPTHKVWAHEALAPHFSGREKIYYQTKDLDSTDFDLAVFPAFRESQPPKSLVVKIRNVLYGYGEPDLYADSFEILQKLRKAGFVCQLSGGIHLCLPQVTR